MDAPYVSEMFFAEKYVAHIIISDGGRVLSATPADAPVDASMPSMPTSASFSLRVATRVVTHAPHRYPQPLLGIYQSLVGIVVISHPGEQALRT